jgi:hypothetical protein
MSETDKAEFNIKVSAPDAAEEELDTLARQLLSELREMEVESAELTRGDSAPAGTKSVDPVMAGSIAIAVLPTLLPKIVEGIQAWVLRGNNRTVKFKGTVGREMVEFEGTAEELQKLLTTLEKGKKKK